MKHSDTINADPAELAKFGQLASRWWDPEGDMGPLHRINPLRLKFIEQQSGDLTGLTICDVGCGGGILSEAMAAKGANVTAIDLAKESLEVARLHLLESGQSVDYKEMTAEALAQQSPQHFDVVTCMEMLEHVPDPESVIRACAQMTKPGGHVIFSTINRNPKAYAFAVVGAEYVLKLLPKGTHDYQKFIKPSELATWARNSGLNITTTGGLEYNPIIDHYKLTDNVDVNYLMASRRA